MIFGVRISGKYGDFAGLGLGGKSGENWEKRIFCIMWEIGLKMRVVFCVRVTWGVILGEIGWISLNWGSKSLVFGVFSGFLKKMS